MAFESHVLLCPVGSAGDVYPLIGLGLALRTRGHRVTILTSGYFREVVEREGLEFVDTLSRQQFLELAGNRLLWHPYRGARTILDSVTVPLLRRAYQAVADLYEPGRSLAVTSCLGFGPRIAHDHLGIPLITVDLQPAVLWSTYDTPVLPGIARGRWVPRWIKQFQYRTGETLVLHPLIRPKLNALRSELGLPPIGRLTNWWHSPQCILGLFPSWYASPAPDWPRQVQLAEFPLWNEHTTQPLPAGVAEFLEAGSPPVVFTPGSANMFGHSFFQAAAEACSVLGRRGMFFTRFAAQIPESLPAGVRHFDYAPFHTLLPRVAAIVHHGGIGTTATAMSAGVPQLIMPLSHDQPDNALRLRRLGIGDSLPPRRFRGPAVARSLDQLLSNPPVAAACREVAARFVNVDPFRTACDIVESLLGKDVPCQAAAQTTDSAGGPH